VGVSPWRAVAAERVGAALLVAGGLSIVMVDHGDGSPMLWCMPEPGLRRSSTGLLGGTVGALMALSPRGKTSGAHINPVVTRGFFLADKRRAAHAVGYILVPLLGTVLGAWPRTRAWKTVRPVLGQTTGWDSREPERR
jgi:aquaporin Z